MARTYNHYFAEGQRAARARHVYANTFAWASTVPVFGERKGWQAQAFACGYRHEWAILENARVKVTT